MRRRTPSSTRTDTLFPHTTLFRSPAHIWVGVSVEDQKGAARVAHLRAAKSAVRFLSVEPLIGSVGPIDLKDIHWVIAGGESGPNARVMRIEWAREIRDACREQRVPFFFKQWGGFRPNSGGRPEERRFGKGGVSTCRSRGWRE